MRHIAERLMRLLDRDRLRWKFHRIFIRIDAMAVVGGEKEPRHWGATRTCGSCSHVRSIGGLSEDKPLILGQCSRLSGTALARYRAA